MSKAKQIPMVTPRLVRQSEAAQILGTRQVLEDAEDAGWIKPVHRRRKLCIYSFRELQEVADRIECGEYPGSHK